MASFNFHKHWSEKKLNLDAKLEEKNLKDEKFFKKKKRTVSLTFSFTTCESQWHTSLEQL